MDISGVTGMRNDNSMNVSGGNTTITASSGTDLLATEIVISSTIGGVAVTSISADAFKNQTKLVILAILE